MNRNDLQHDSVSQLLRPMLTFYKSISVKRRATYTHTFTHTVSHKSEYTPHICVNVILYLEH